MFFPVKNKTIICPFCDKKVMSGLRHLSEHKISLNDCLELLSKSSIGASILKDNKEVKQFVYIRGNKGMSLKYRLSGYLIECFFIFSGTKARTKKSFHKELSESEIGLEIKRLYLNNTPIKEIISKLNVTINIVDNVCKELKITNTINIPYTNCIICSSKLSRASISAHLKSKHNMSYKQYEEVLIQDFIRNEQKVKELKYWYCEQRANQRFIYENFGLTLCVLKTILKNLGIRIRRNNEAIAGNSFWFMYKNEFYQSTWELQFAWWLEHNNIQFETHSKIGFLDYLDSQTKNKKRKYFPDFYVPSWNSYVEIKGRTTELSTQKMVDVKKYNPNVNIKILKKDFFIENNIFKIEKLVNKSVYDYAWFVKTKERQIDFLTKNKELIFKILCTFKEPHKKIIREFKIRYHVLYRFLSLVKDELTIYKNSGAHAINDN